MRRTFMALLYGLPLAACATIVKGTTQIVAVSTPGVQGATCTLSSPAIGTHTIITPGTTTLEKSKDDINVRCTKKCYADGAGVISSNLQAVTAGNIILGGVVGLGIDAAPGAMNQYTPEIQVVMTPTRG